MREELGERNFFCELCTKSNFLTGETFNSFLIEAPTARNVTAQGNALGNVNQLEASAESAYSGLMVEQLRAFSADNFRCRRPGPVVQAVAFRAFGAEKVV